MSFSTALTTTITLCLLFVAPHFTHVQSHGAVTIPRQRGALNPPPDLDVEILDKDAETNFCSHCNNGGGKGAVLEASGGDWKLYEPLDKDFKFAAGLCGDPLKGPEDHKKGGKFYNDGKVVEMYEAGATIDLEIAINAHHNGYMEMFVCDLDACETDDIEQECFKGGHCQKLLRAPNDLCDDGDNEGCGPIDSVYPGRWYLPCRSGEKWQFFGGVKGTMRFKLPEGLTCKKCVLQWYWATGNSCNPRGMEPYFTGEDKPNWGSCSGDGGSIGGVSLGLGECGGGSSPEEFWGCSDISITSTSEQVVKSEPGEEEENQIPEKPEELEPNVKESPSPLPSESPSAEPSESSEAKASASPSNEASKSASPKASSSSPPAASSAIASTQPTPAPSKSASPDPSLAAPDSPEKEKDAVEEPSNASECIEKYKRCGGVFFSGSAKCCDGSKCVNISSSSSICLSSTGGLRTRFKF
eukprot:Plantae.Rhodophyta-Hildenbrandia_rubra.ctg3259.p1 GENE.Plantae.Rhodophyta-Hildenbrandia_rubra.ctg3259~~Plantae.Rhodophyta-Hildenbrandia_rubra.ctg3259.p1  ORF type:complete len:490 (-),score=65.65 Plantae.Rhodophyta-Hildenbrandia_rubra.ctg3259:1546-2952(-)